MFNINRLPYSVLLVECFMSDLGVLCSSHREELYFPLDYCTGANLVSYDLHLLRPDGTKVGGPKERARE